MNEVLRKWLEAKQAEENDAKKRELASLKRQRIYHLSELGLFEPNTGDAYYKEGQYVGNSQEARGKSYDQWIAHKVIEVTDDEYEAICKYAPYTPEAKKTPESVESLKTENAAQLADIKLDKKFQEELFAVLQKTCKRVGIISTIMLVGIALSVLCGIIIPLA